jgi:hypothetical protein
MEYPEQIWDFIIYVGYDRSSIKDGSKDGWHKEYMEFFGVATFCV